MNHRLTRASCALTLIVASLALIPITPRASALQPTLGGGLWTVALDGSEPTPISPTGSDPAWSPDGGQIAFVTTGGAGMNAIAVSDAAGGQARIVADTTEYMDQLPSWSPDGTRIAFVTGDGALHVVEADGSNLLRLIGPSGQGPMRKDYVRRARPAWSPDGSQIVFVNGYFEGVSMPPMSTGADDAGENIDAPPEIPIMEGEEESPIPEPEIGEDPPLIDEPPPIDGPPLIDEPALDKVPTIDEPPPPPPSASEGGFDDDSAATINPEHGGIYVMDADGSAQRRVTDLLADPETAPSWAPDGTTLVFAVADFSGASVWRLRLDGSDPVALTEFGYSYRPSYSPDGSRIAAVAIEVDGVLVGAADGTGVSSVLGGRAFVLSMAWSPDGREIAFQVYGELGEIDQAQGVYVAAADGSGAVRIVAGGSQPAPSPDGSLIAYTAAGSGSVALMVVGWDGAGAREIVSLPDYPLMPSWSPDGSKIAFLTYGDDVNFILWTVNVDGSGLTELTPGAGSYPYQPAWSPDGSAIAFVGPGTGGSDLWIINADGSGATQLTDLPDETEAPVFSPDGSLIAFAEQDYGVQQRANALYVVRPDGTDLIALTQWTAGEDPSLTNIGVRSGPSWSPDGARLAIPSIEGVAVIQVDGSGAEILPTGDVGQITDVAYSPDGSRFAISYWSESEDAQLQPGDTPSTGGPEDIYVVNVDGSDLMPVGETPLVDLHPLWSPDGTMIVFGNEGAGN